MNWIDPSRETQLIQFLSVAQALLAGPSRRLLVVLERSLQTLSRQTATTVVDDHRLELGDQTGLDDADVRLLHGGNDDRASTVDGAVDRRAVVDGVVEAVTVGIGVGVGVAVGAGREDHVVGEDRGDVAAEVGRGVQDPEFDRRARLDGRERDGEDAGGEPVDVRSGVELHGVGDPLDLVADAVDDLALDGRDLDLGDRGRVGAGTRRERDDRELGLDSLGCRRRHDCEECCGHEAAENSTTHVEPTFPAEAELGLAWTTNKNVRNWIIKLRSQTRQRDHIIKRSRLSWLSTPLVCTYNL